MIFWVLFIRYVYAKRWITISLNDLKRPGYSELNEL